MAPPCGNHQTSILIAYNTAEFKVILPGPYNFKQSPRNGVDGPPDDGTAAPNAPHPPHPKPMNHDASWVGKLPEQQLVPAHTFQVDPTN
jgi:hypothetical protein